MYVVLCEKYFYNVRGGGGGGGGGGVALHLIASTVQALKCTAIL